MIREKIKKIALLSIVVITILLIVSIFFPMKPYSNYDEKLNTNYFYVNFDTKGGSKIESQIIGLNEVAY